MLVKQQMEELFTFSDGNFSNLGVSLAESNVLSTKELLLWRICATLILIVPIGASLMYPVITDNALNSTNAAASLLSMQFWGFCYMLTYFMLAIINTVKHMRRHQDEEKVDRSNRYCKRPAWMQLWQLFIFEIAMPWILLTVIVLAWQILAYHDFQLFQLIAIIGMLVTIVSEFLFSRIKFQWNHVVLTMVAISIWFFVQMVWIFAGSIRPNSYIGWTFNDYKSCIFCILGFAVIAGSFYVCKSIAKVRDMRLFGIRQLRCRPSVARTNCRRNSNAKQDESMTKTADSDLLSSASCSQGAFMQSREYGEGVENITRFDS